MINKVNLLFILTILVSCQLIQNDEESESNDLLIKSSKEFVIEDGGHIDHKYGSTQEFERQNFKVKYYQDTIYVQTIQYVNACGDAIAWIEINGDTLILTTKEQKEQLCNSAHWYTYEYWIENPDNKKYIIKLH